MRLLDYLLDCFYLLECSLFYYICSGVSIVAFEQVKAGWVDMLQCWKVILK